MARYWIRGNEIAAFEKDS